MFVQSGQLIEPILYHETSNIYLYVRSTGHTDTFWIGSNEFNRFDLKTTWSLSWLLSAKCMAMTSRLHSIYEWEMHKLSRYTWQWYWRGLWKYIYIYIYIYIRCYLNTMMNKIMGCISHFRLIPCESKNCFGIFMFTFHVKLISTLCGIYASVNWDSIALDNGLSPIRRQTII